MQQVGVTFLPILLHPKSRGVIKLRDSNPLSPPIIDPRYLEDEYDVKVLVEVREPNDKWSSLNVTIIGFVSHHRWPSFQKHT